MIVVYVEYIGGKGRLCDQTLASSQVLVVSTGPNHINDSHELLLIVNN